MRVGLDTGILIAALITSDTPPVRIYRVWRRGLVRTDYFRVAARGILPRQSLSYASELHQTGRGRTFGEWLETVPNVLRMLLKLDLTAVMFTLPGEEQTKSGCLALVRTRPGRKIIDILVRLDTIYSIMLAINALLRQQVMLMIINGIKYLKAGDLIVRLRVSWQTL